jgi:hypothetical protein
VVAGHAGVYSGPVAGRARADESVRSSLRITHRKEGTFTVLCQKRAIRLPWVEGRPAGMRGAVTLKTP